MQIEKILERIKLDSSKNYEPTLETLQLLQKQYLLNVPYENLDFVLNKEFSTDLLKIYEKIVNNKRGGICYESHTLFVHLLKTLGFTAYLIFAKVEDLTYIGKDYPHLIILVSLDGIEYLVDVAYGQNIREPMNINDENYISIAENNEYKIGTKENEYTLLINYKQKSWLPIYHFTKEEKKESDFADVFKNDNYDSITKNIPLLVSLAKENGRITMQDEMITLKEDKKRSSWNISKEQRSKILKDYFNMTIEI